MGLTNESSVDEMADEGEKSPLLSSHAHRDNEQGLKWTHKRSFASSCGNCALSAATLPLALFRRKKSDEVGEK